MNISSLNTEARLLVDADTVSYTAADLLRRINNAYEETVGLILGCDGKWQFDDSNYTVFPIGETTLVASQNDYTFDSTHLEIERVQILDSGGIWKFLHPIDISQISIAIEEFHKTDGVPIYYDKQGSSILLYPAPAASAVTLTNGLRVFFKRTASIFTTAEVTTGTKQPGFVSLYHIVLAYKAALPYAQAYKKDRVAGFINEINRLEKGIVKHYSRREQDRRKRITMAGVNPR